MYDTTKWTKSKWETQTFQKTTGNAKKYFDFFEKKLTAEILPDGKKKLTGTVSGHVIVNLSYHSNKKEGISLSIIDGRIPATPKVLSKKEMVGLEPALLGSDFGVLGIVDATPEAVSGDVIFSAV